MGIPSDRWGSGAFSSFSRLQQRLQQRSRRAAARREPLIFLLLLLIFIIDPHTHTKLSSAQWIYVHVCAHRSLLLCKEGGRKGGRGYVVEPKHGQLVSTTPYCKSVRSSERRLFFQPAAAVPLYLHFVYYYFSLPSLCSVAVAQKRIVVLSPSLIIDVMLCYVLCSTTNSQLR